MFQRTEDSCIMCKRARGRPVKTIGEELHPSHTEPSFIPFKYTMIDCTGSYTFPEKKNIYCLVAVCMQTKLVTAIGISGRKVDDFLRALNVLFTEQGTPQHIFIDAESALVSVLKDDLNFTHD